MSLEDAGCCQSIQEKLITTTGSSKEKGSAGCLTKGAGKKKGRSELISWEIGVQIIYRAHREGRKGSSQGRKNDIYKKPGAMAAHSRNHSEITLMRIVRSGGKAVEKDENGQTRLIRDAGASGGKEERAEAKESRHGWVTGWGGKTYSGGGDTCD